jgi:serine/alanine racemase
MTACPRARAWIELDPDALRRNVQALRGLLPPGCGLMPAVKADAYGHGAVLIARELQALGVNAFCVATAEEGAALRRAGIGGTLLVLGYTHPEQLPLLTEHDLTQTVVDADYGRALNAYGRLVRAHVAVDTGMHRLGIPAEETRSVVQLLRSRRLRVEGIYTHLCAPGDADFTRSQTTAFFGLRDRLRCLGFCPKTHLLSSGSLLRWPELGGDYARAGLALYGALGPADAAVSPVDLRPVLSLKARVALTRRLRPGEHLGYDLAYTAERERSVAVLSIGYADGVPRALSCGRGSVLLNGKRAPVLGRICMDQMMVDITQIEGVSSGDEAVLIGKSGSLEQSAAALAEAAGTIPNELLSRLGPRLPRIDMTE